MYVKTTRKQIVEGVISLELSDQAKTAPWDNFLVCQILRLFTLLRINALTNFNTRVALPYIAIEFIPDFSFQMAHKRNLSVFPM